MNKRRKINIVGFGFAFFTLTSVIFIIGSIVLNAYESKLNTDIQILERQNRVLHAEIDGLEIELSAKTDYRYLSEVAERYGYTHNSNQIAYVVRQ